MSVHPTGSDFHSRDISDEEAQAEEEAPPVNEDVPSKGHSLIVKSRDSKNKVSLVIKPIRSSTEETPESMSEDHVKSSSEESPKPAENNESSSSRPMEDGSRVVQQNDLLSKLVGDTITDKPNEQHVPGRGRDQPSAD